MDTIQIYYSCLADSAAIRVETAARKQIIRDNFAQRGFTLTNLALVAVKTTRIAGAARQSVIDTR